MTMESKKLRLLEDQRFDDALLSMFNGAIFKHTF